MDVKSLFKSGKKSIKAFKIASAPTSDIKQDESKADGSLEAWEAPAVSQPAPTVNLKVDVEEYKAEETSAPIVPTASWSVDAVPEPMEEKVERVSSSTYVPPSQRRAELGKTMPTLAEASKTVSTGLKVAAKPSAGSVGGLAGPPRLKLITSAAKKAQEDEERRREEERKRKEEEKQARKEALRAEMEKTTSGLDSENSPVPVSNEIKAASLDKIYAKYVGRAKTGRKLAVKAA
jgi:hypothetical protein